MNEIVYLLTNEAMPDYVKIGRTSDNLEQRIREHNSSTSIPLPFECFHASMVKDASTVLQRLYNTFENNRIDPGREFLHVTPERVAAILKLAEIENVTPQNDFAEAKES